MAVATTPTACARAVSAAAPLPTRIPFREHLESSEDRTSTPGTFAARLTAAGPSIPIVALDQIMIATSAQLSTLPRPFRVERTDAKNNEVSVPQELVPVAELTSLDRELILHLERLSHDQALNHDTYERAFREQAFADSRMNEHLASVDLPPLSDQSMASRAKDAAEQQTRHGFEIGAWRIVLHSGRVITDIHTSYEGFNVDGAVAERALLRALARVPDRDPHQVAAIEFFHPHPIASPLSFADGRVTEKLGATLAAEGYQGSLHIFCFGRLDGDLVVFHHGR